MTATDAMGSIQRIQATFDQLVAPASARSTSATTSTLSTADLFAQLVEALSASSASTTGSGAATGENLVKEAEKYLGTPYVFGGTTANGIDCSALVQNAAKALGIEIPRVVADQKNAGTEVESLAKAKPGDLIVINGGSHIVMYAGNNEVVHAPVPGQVVKREKVWFDDSDVVTIRRIVPEQTVATPSVTLDSLQSLINAQSAILSRSVS